MSVLYGTILSDHIPVMVEIDLQLAPDVEHGASNDVRCKIDWSVQSKNVLYEYGVQIEYLLRDVEIPTDVLLCKDCNCTNVEHKVALQKYYDSRMCAITTAGQNTIKTITIQGLKKLTCQVGRNLPKSCLKNIRFTTYSGTLNDFY